MYIADMHNMGYILIFARTFDEGLWCIRSDDYFIFHWHPTSEKAMEIFARAT